MALLYALLGYCSMALMQVCAKVLLTLFTPYNLLLYRAFTLMFINYWIIIRQGSQFDLPDRKRTFQFNTVFRSVLKRMIFSVGGILPVLYAVQYIPISTNMTLQNTGPIFVFFV